MSEIGVNHHIDGDGVLHVVFDRPRDKVNLLSAEILEYLDQLLEEAADSEELRGLAFLSAKPRMFLAGMDVEEIASLTDSVKAAAGARSGQRVFQRIADLPVPSACAIGGPCLGGGTELALACTFRIASDHKAVQIGLPEVQLGIIPGFGGTQRLPRLVGLETALGLILKGTRLDGRRAKRIGLVDEVVPEAYLERETLAWIRKAAGRPRFRAPRKRGLLATLKEGPLRSLAIGTARKSTAASVDPAAYPAPFRAIECVEAAYTMPLQEGLDFEARTLGDLVPTRTAKNLIWLFKSQTALKKEAPGQASPRKVRRAAVLGAGVMGGGIAQLVADREVPVRVKDIRYDAILTALRTAAKVWRKKVERKRMTPREARQRMGFIAPTLEDTGMGRVDLVIEAVVEDLAIKQKVLAGAEAVLPERAVFASNTSTLPITDIASRALRPERVVGMHFFNPVDRMPLVEVIAGHRSSPEAVATVHAFAIELGKTPVVVRDAPGFLVNRILMVYLNEAMRLHAEGVGIDLLDRSMTAFGMPMGPFALLDQVGLDVARHAARVLEAAFGKRIGTSAPLLDTMVESGRLGAKNGKGFYRYRDGKRGEVDSAVAKLASPAAPREVPVPTLQERMVLAMVNEAAICLEDGIVEQPRDVDVAMVLGTGFPPFRGGLLRHADEIGIPVLVDRLSRLADAHGERFRPSAALREMVREERRFYPEG